MKRSQQPVPAVPCHGLRYSGLTRNSRLSSPDLTGASRLEATDRVDGDLETIADSFDRRVRGPSVTTAKYPFALESNRLETA